MDDGDISSKYENDEMEVKLANHRNREKEKPEFDDDGAKICIGCGTLIPEARARLDFVVRCIDCQEFEERAAFR